MIDLRCARMSLAFLAGVLLAGCASGGGGGGSVLPPPNPPPPPPPPAAAPIGPVTAPQAGVPSGTEFTANWGVGAVNAPTAWQRGFTGQGVKIGVLDDGIVATNDPAYAELDGRIEPASKDIDGARNQLSTTLSHGAELSSLIAGNFNGDKTVGVAYGASILAVRTDNGAGGFEYQALADALDYAVQQGVRIVNFSLGSPSSGGAAGVALREAIRRATTAGVIIVVSAGNDGAGAASVNYPGFYATDASVSNNLILVAGGMNQAAGGGSVYGDFNTVSNPAGAAASWYLTAPGWQIIVPDYGPTGPVPGFQTCGGALCVIQ
ncbi:MAG: S8 family serine peptidase, partial [Hyphomonadaceae bacterium]